MVVFLASSCLPEQIFNFPLNLLTQSSVRLSGTVSVSDYTLCMRSVGLAERVMSLTFRRNVNLRVPRCTCGKRKRVLTSTVHIPKKSLMIH